MWYCTVREQHGLPIASSQADTRIPVPEPLKLEDGVYTLWRVGRDESSNYSTSITVERGQFRLPDIGPLTDRNEEVFLSFLRTDTFRDQQPSEPTPTSTLKQAISNLSAVLELHKRNVLKAEDVLLCMHFRSGRFTPSGPNKVSLGDGSISPGGVSTRDASNEAFAKGSKAWDDWQKYIQLRQQAERAGIRLPVGKLYRHLRVGSSDLPSGDQASLKLLIDRLTAETGNFNYSAYSELEATELARISGAEVYLVEGLEAPSTLIRRFGNQDFSDFILVRRNLPSAVRAFLIVYEVCHIRRDLVNVQNVVECAPPDSAVVCLPIHLLERDSDSKAEKLAMTSLLPTPEIAWEFRHVHDAVLQDSSRIPRLLREPQVLNQLRRLLPADRSDDQGAEESAYLSLGRIIPQFDDLLADRLRGALEHVQKYDTWFRRAINRDVFDWRVLEASKLVFDGTWAQIDNDNRLVDFSDSYGALLGLDRSIIQGRSVLDFADEKTRARFFQIRQEWQAGAPHHTIYFFGFCLYGGGTALAKVLTVPVVVDGQLNGAFALLDPVHTSASLVGILTGRGVFRNNDAAFVVPKLQVPAVPRLSELSDVTPMTLKVGGVEEVPFMVNAEESWRLLRSGPISLEKERMCLEELIIIARQDEEVGKHLVSRLLDQNARSNLPQMKLYVSACDELRLPISLTRFHLASGLLSVASQMSSQNNSEDYCIRTALSAASRLIGFHVLGDVATFLSSRYSEDVWRTALECVTAVLSPAPLNARACPSDLYDAVSRKLDESLEPHVPMRAPRTLALASATALGLLRPASTQALVKAVRAYNSHNPGFSADLANAFARVVNRWSNVAAVESATKSLKGTISELQMGEVRS